MACAQAPVASFTTNVSSGCAPLNIYFTNTSSQANSYYWNFGNGNTSTLPNPSMVYSVPGTFTVTLIATNTINGLKDTITQTITVVPNPVANFTASPLTSCAGASVVSFTNTSLNSSSYTWDFGDGYTSTATNPVHVYATAGTYTVKLIASNSFGCFDIRTAASYILIRANPVAQFTSNLSSTCNPGTVFTFNCTTSGITSWYWNFGDGATASTQNPNHVYGAPGSYTITLVVTDSYGCMDTLVSPNYINIGASLVPSFTVNSTTGCLPFNCIFNCTVPNATSWQWNFGDGTTSTLQNPSHLYATAGSYNITLTVTTASGCNGTVILNNYITVDALPVASFTTVQDSGCLPFTPVFNNTSTGSTSWLWDFGDATNSTQQNPVHQYNAVGSYNVTLHAYSANGCESIITVNNAVVVRKAIASFNASNNIGCPPLNVTFNSSASTPNIVGWNWNFGDGNTSTLQNPSHIYNTLGNYSVTLIVTNNLGCRDTMLRYNYVKVVSGVTSYTMPDTIKLCAPGVINCVDPTFGSNTWAWTFGDGGTANTRNPTHTYINPGIYTITLSNNMAGNCPQTFNPYAIVQVFPVSLAPINSINVSPCSPYTVSVSNSTPSVGSYQWDFGDGGSSTLPNPSHNYTAAGTYTITLTLTMQSGCTTELTKTVTVGHPNPITANGPKFCLGDPAQFGISNPLAFTSYLWNFGDGNNSVQPNPSHLYAASGVYTVSLTTTDTSGCVDNYTYPTVIIVSNPLPSFTVSGPTIGCTSMLVNFNNTSTGYTSCSWDFGDGTNSTAFNPSHLYNAPGVYTVTLSASANACTRTTTHVNQIIINNPQCNFMYNAGSACLPATVTFTDLSSNPVSWTWDFGDGTTSNLQNPTHTYTTIPTGSITLTITDIYGCTATRTKANINILQANFTASDTVTCKNYPVTFSDLSGTGSSWQWNFGDGTTSTAQNPVHAYATTGVFSVSLVVTFPQGCNDTIIFPNYVSVSSPQADFTSPTIAGCSPTQINYNNLSSNATNYLWMFGDSTTSAAPSPSHIYNIPGYYTVDLVAYDSAGCADTMHKVDYIFIPGTYTQFTVTGTSGCEMFNAVFTDNSIGASTWSWNFGDGNISNIPSPVHTYTDSGSYMVTLITQDTLGCSSYYTYPTPITVYANPIANATTQDTLGCQPYAVAFSNLSTGADTYLWVFGDGDTSSQVTPVHTYLTPAIYAPYLIASTNYGCIDTFYLTTGIAVKQSPVSTFSSNTLTGCDPATFTLTNNSTGLLNPSYTWTSGNGNTLNTQQASFSYGTPGNYDISLVVTNSNGCTDSTAQQVTVYTSPVANATTTDLSGCNPYTSSMTNLSTGAVSYQWDFGDGNTDTATSPVHTYLQSGVFNVSLVAYNSQGCTDTFLLPAPVTVNLSPVAAFTVDQQAGCPGTTFAFSDLSTNTLPGASWSWNIGGNIFSQQNPFITINSPGLYDVSLVINNNNGCTDSTGQLTYIQVYDTIPPPVTPIKSVSVTSNSTVEITCGISTAPDFAAYILYRFNPATSNFIPILVDSNQHNGGINLTFTYTDSMLNTLTNVYTYRLETFDQCSYSTGGSQLTSHTTMDVTAATAGKNIAVSWTPYAGCPVSSYIINRQDQLAGSWQVIATVPPNQFSYIDSSLTCPFNYGYRIDATELCGEIYTSMSDTSVAAPENEMADQEVEIVRSTVINEQSVLTEWLSPVLFPNRVVMYNIYRSTDSVNYQFIAAVPVAVQSYVDYDVNVDAQNYYYKVMAVNDCSLENSQFTNSSSILLRGSWQQMQTTLYWTQYREWDTGVNRYVIEKLDSNGQWQVIKVVDGTINTTILDE